MIILHFYLPPQFKYELFHPLHIISLPTGRYKLNKLTSLPMCGVIAQLVEHRTGIRGGPNVGSKRTFRDFYMTEL